MPSHGVIVEDIENEPLGVKTGTGRPELAKSEYRLEVPVAVP
jgi:hypothetical protein